MSAGIDHNVLGVAFRENAVTAGSEDAARVVIGRRFSKELDPSKSCKETADRLKLMFAGFGKVISASLSLFDAKEINGFEKKLKNLKEKCDKIEDPDERLGYFSNEFLSIKRVVATKKMQPLQKKLNDLKKILSMMVDDMSFDARKRDVFDLIERLPSSLTVGDDQLESDQLEKVRISLENEMAQIKKDLEVIVVKYIFEKKNKDFIGAAKISRRDYPKLSHSYFVIREEKDGKVEFTLQQQFHKKLSEKGFICSGGMKDVYKLKNPKTGEVSGVRSVLKQDRAITSHAIEAAQEFRDDPNLCGGHYLTYISSNSGEVKYVFLHPYMNGGDLIRFLQKIGKVDQSLQIKIMLQVCLGVKNMHDRGWLHRDIKLENILVQIDPKKSETILKLADFDFAEKPEKNSQLNPLGTPIYVAPELLRRRVFGLENGKNCDIYSLGMTFWGISELKTPSLNTNNLGELDPPRTYFELIHQRDFPVLEKQTPIQKLIFEMINPVAPNKRPSIDDVISRLESLYQKNRVYSLIRTESTSSHR